MTQVTWGSGNYRTDFTYDGPGLVGKRAEFYSTGGTELSDRKFGDFFSRVMTASPGGHR